jgi:hypothetical protein
MYIQSFLDYWSEDPDNTIFPEARLFRAYMDQAATLRELKGQGRTFIVPGKDSRGRWIPVFDEGRTDEIANLSGNIEAASAKLKSICNDVIEIVALMGGPCQKDISSELSSLRTSLRLLENLASKETERATKMHPGKRPGEIEALPEVSLAYSKLDSVRAANKPRIEAIEGKLAKVREICEGYNG